MGTNLEMKEIIKWSIFMIDVWSKNDEVGDVPVVSQSVGGVECTGGCFGYGCVTVG